jgi:hypothetical protein
MSTQVERAGKILAYDGQCPMCLSTVAFLERAGLVKPEQAQSIDDLPPGDVEVAQAAGIRNQLVVLDPLTGQTRAGFAGLLWLAGDNVGRPPWLRILALPGIRHALEIAYETVSYNRRVISPPRQPVRCDCEPEVTLGRRVMLIVPLAVLMLLTTALFGAAVFHGLELGSVRAGALVMTATAGAASAVLIVAAVAMLRGQLRVDYIAHLVVTMFVGALVLVPASLTTWWLPREANLVIVGVSVLAGFALMRSMQRSRVAVLGLSAVWLWAWMVALAVAAGCSFWILA